MRKGLTKIKLIAVAIFVAALITIAFFGYYHGLLDDFSNAGDVLQTSLSNRITTSTCFVESMTTYGEKFFKNGGTENDSEYLKLLKYDSSKDSYSMDGLKGTTYTKLIGNLTGTGTIPNSGIDRDEINMALSLNDYFAQFSKRLPEIAWIYYTSENGFINMYPWISSTEFNYTDELKDVAFYSAATPENDPSRKLVWTPVYVDAAGKGLMITISNPVYYGDVFKGVLSLDFTTDIINQFLQSDYDSYMVDESYSVVASGVSSETDTDISKINKLMRISDAGFLELKEAENETVHSAGSYIIYKASISDSPFTLVMTVSKARVFWKSIYYTLPEILVGILLFVTFFMILNLRKAKEKLRNTTLIDPLTGLKNRRYLDMVIEDEIARSERYKQSLSIASLDLDHFKKVNDTWGHQVGDEVLRLTAKTVKSAIRQSDVMIRLGGEEFLILMPLTDIEAAYMVSERARRAIEEENHPVAGKFTASFGVIERLTGESYNNMFRRVDEALYVAKASGRNCVKRYEGKDDKSPVTVRMEWNKAWECGEATIDRQHREIIVLGNELIGMTSASQELIEQKLDILISRFEEHFESEERIIRQVGYPDIEQHARIHRQLVERLTDIKESAKTEELKVSTLIAFVVNDAIIGHLLEEDIKFFTYFKK